MTPPDWMKPLPFGARLARLGFGLWLVLLGGILARGVVAQQMIPDTPAISATSYILMDAETGTVISKNNEHQPLPPASLTKMMTAYVLESEVGKGNVSLEDEALVSIKAWRTGGSKMFIREGTLVPVRELLKGIVIQSGNDASIAVAEHVAGGEDAFADLMNQYAAELGMKNTNFTNATGLPGEDHYASAYDMAILAQAIIADYPEHYDLYAEKEYTYNDITQKNRNKLLWRDPTVDGLKTGYTEEAGYCLVASARKDNMRLITVVMGASGPEARVRQTQKLLSYGFRFYESLPLFKAGETVTETRVWSGAADSLSLGVTRDIQVTVPRGTGKALGEPVIEIPPVVRAPVAEGETLGKVKVMLKDEVLAEAPLQALEEVEPGSWFKRIWHAICLFFMALIQTG